MDQNTFSHIQLWCPRPFGTYSQNKPCGGSPVKKPFGDFACRTKEGEDSGEACSENTPPAPAPPPPLVSPSSSQGEEGRVLLDTWYVIKPGNTKEKIAFFVAHQCSSSGRASTMKVKGKWGNDSSKAKRRRRSHDPSKAKPCPGKDKDGSKEAEDVYLCPEAPAEPGGDTDLLSVAEMVALVEQRTALALQGYSRPCPGGAPAAPASPVVFLSGAHTKDKITCDLYQLISPSRDSLPNNVDFLLSSAAPKGDGASEPPDLELSCGESQALPGKLDAGPEGRAGEKLGGAAATPRDCVAGFHVDVVVTGVVDQCVFFGKDSTKTMKEETVCLTVGTPTPDGLCSACEDPPPGQLFFLHTQASRPEDTREAAGSLLDSKNNGEGGPDGPGLEPAASDASLCRLYRHVSHDFLEIRFKIQRLLEPRQYMLLLPEHIMVKIFSHLPTQSLAALKCTCHYFKSIIETFGVQATDSRWNRDPLYRDDPCKQCKKHYEKGDVSLCRWHPKPYHHDLPYGRSYWMCCRRTDKDTPGCRVGLHDNNWVLPCDMLRDRAARREDGR
ncbi:F-box only protein 46 isoform X2 [Mauremys mutica]|uniref:F-box only protein 46 isoform X2 n=1 Tax=Mauremys mutica TaxID=74926 RepID=UPI001D168514|nr:F-box only protein 46 isoform X2 [Mauremys mutica]